MDELCRKSRKSRPSCFFNFPESKFTSDNLNITFVVCRVSRVGGHLRTGFIRFGMFRGSGGSGESSPTFRRFEFYPLEIAWVPIPPECETDFTAFRHTGEFIFSWSRYSGFECTRKEQLQVDAEIAEFRRWLPRKR